MPSQSHKRGKPATRRTLLSRRDALAVDERERGSTRACDGAAALLGAQVQRGRAIGAYAAKGSEVDTARLDAWARANGIVVAYPRVVEDTRVLAFHAAAIGELVVTRFGLREPRADAPAIDLASIAAFVVPGLAFDRAGGRVGWGRGHYDTTLAAAPRALSIGLAFEIQLVDRVPRDPHDRHVDVIVTDVATYWVGS